MTWPILCAFPRAFSWDISWRWVAVLILLIMVLPAQVRAQSFECAKATRPSERVICSAPQLSQLDANMAASLKDVLATAPELRVALLAGQRRWLARRDRLCAKSASQATSECLVLLYKARISELDSGAALDRARQDMTAPCDTAVQRYRKNADAQPGKSPLEVLTQSSASGITITRASNIDSPGSLSNWAKAQKRPFIVPAELGGEVNQMGGTFIDWLPGTNYYALSSIQGTAHCYYTHYFRVIGGRAVVADPPPGIDQSGDGEGCEVARSYGAIDNVPVFFEETFDASPSMQATLQLASWDAGQFAAACRITFKYAPRFRELTVNDWMRMQDSARSCTAGDCENLRKTAFALAAEVQSGPVAAWKRYHEMLSPDQRELYAAAIQDQDPDDEPADDPGNLVEASTPTYQTTSIRFPYVDHGQLYEVIIGHFSIGWRTFGDWSVRFDEIKDGQHWAHAAFAVGMIKGQLLGASVEPIMAQVAQTPDR